MKRNYVEPELEVIRYDEEDVIMTSGCIEACDSGDDCPDGEEGGECNDGDDGTGRSGT